LNRKLLPELFVFATLGIGDVMLYLDDVDAQAAQLTYHRQQVAQTAVVGLSNFGDKFHALSFSYYKHIRSNALILSIIGDLGCSPHILSVVDVYERLRRLKHRQTAAEQRPLSSDLPDSAQVELPRANIGWGQLLAVNVGGSYAPHLVVVVNELFGVVEGRRDKVDTEAGVDLIATYPLDGLTQVRAPTAYERGFEQNYQVIVRSADTC
jgi:hypothetical protein